MRASERECERACARSLFGLQRLSVMPDCGRFKVAGVAQAQLKVCAVWGKQFKHLQKLCTSLVSIFPTDPGMHDLISEILLFISFSLLAPSDRPAGGAARPSGTVSCALVFNSIDSHRLLYFALLRFLRSSALTKS